ncbi:MAG: GNAT family N-acetyltransferase [Dactylosporangium sp.]|nr:GNAT family N-acetyltransferase [Dactylosporangium sp.]
MGIVRAGHRDAHQVAAVIATAFRSLDVAAWLIAVPDDRQRVLYGQFRILVEHALDHGPVLMAGDRRAVAVWFPRDTPLPEIDDYDRRLELACGQYTDRFRLLDAAFDKHHPDEAHHHLALLAVDPDQQARGRGSALLECYHARLDKVGLPAYLEASSARSRELYLRHGYVDHGPPIVLPKDGPSLWPMWRRPQPPMGSTR